MYRASSDVKWYALENVDLADISGVLKYVHTEVIAEHTQSIPARPARKYWIAGLDQHGVHFFGHLGIFEFFETSIKHF